jgi:putative nucleotidyltransferase with HDIG domain
LTAAAQASFHTARQLATHLTARRRLFPPPWLTPVEAGLFHRMSPADQVEGLAVAATLEEWGHGSDRNLLLAGLLHDVGKSLAPPDARHRVVMTLLETLAPRLLPSLAARSKAIDVLRNHAALGAQLAAGAGLPDDVRRLVAQHHQPPHDVRTEALQQADGMH